MLVYISCKTVGICAVFRFLAILRRVGLSVALVILFCVFVPHPLLLADEPVSADRTGRVPLGAAGLSVERVECPHDLLFLGQINVPIRVSVVNSSDVGIFVQVVSPVFTASTYGDRMSDYQISGTLNPNVILLPGSEHVFDFSVDVLPTALTDSPIRVDGAVRAVRLDSMIALIDTTAAEPHNWTIISEGVTAVLGLFDTKNTPHRSDDSLLCYIEDEQFAFDSEHYLNDGEILTNMIVDEQTTYRLVVQINPSTDWNWQLSIREQGYFNIEESDKQFGEISNQQYGTKQLLITDENIPDQMSDGADILRGCTIEYPTVEPWDMYSDPWSDPSVDGPLTMEIGTVVQSGWLGRIVDCTEGGNNWEVTDTCQAKRYYFFETWFLPDYEWANWDTVDLYLHIDGAFGAPDINELHARFVVNDDDSLPPQYSDFSPSLVPAGMGFDITCRITDPSGVYDDWFGSDGDGIYLEWDTDGDLDNGSNEIEMSSIGGEYYSTESQVPGLADGTEVVYRIRACDDDFDYSFYTDRVCGFSEIQTIQVLSEIYLEDEPGSLYPYEAFSGEGGILFHIEFSNSTTYDISIGTASTLSFSDSTYTVAANLANNTIVPSGATLFPVSFGPVDIPTGFTAPDTCLIELDMHGTYNSGASLFEQRWIASNENMLEIHEPRALFVSHAIPAQPVNPGDRLVELMRFELINESPGDMSIDSFRIDNVTKGSPAPNLQDLDISRIYLYREPAYPAVAKAADDEPKERGIIQIGESPDQDDFENDAELLLSRPFSQQDILIDSVVFEEGSATFALGEDGSLGPGEHCYCYVLADVDSFLARDGDSLDIEIESETSVFASGIETVVLDEEPLNSDGVTPIDGCMSFQLTMEESTPDTIYTAEIDQPVLAFVVPANGYYPDLLQSVTVEHYGDERIFELIDRLALWLDDGDGLFSAEMDLHLGELVSTGIRYELSGLSVLADAPTRLFVTADFMQGQSQEFYAFFGIPSGGIEFSSGNDGPLDGDLMSPKMQLLVRREVISIQAVDLDSEIVNPGRRDVEILGLRLENGTLGPVTLDSLTVTCDSLAFGCTPTSRIDLYLDDGDESFDPSVDALLVSSLLDSWRASFNGISLEILQDDHALLFTSTDVDSFFTIDAICLSAGIDSEQDISIRPSEQVVAEVYSIEAEFPLTSTGAPLTDGMLAHQVTLYDHGDTTIVEQADNVLILDFQIPGNGCLDDTLTAVSVINEGTAGIEHIDRVQLWTDDGDGVFEPMEDGHVADFLMDLHAGNVFRVSNLDVAIPGAAGRRFFVSVDIDESLDSGATIIAGIPIMGIRVSSGNDGPLDSKILSESTLIVPVPDRITFFSNVLASKRVEPGEKRVLNMVLGAYNSYSGIKTLESLLLVNVGTIDSLELEEVEIFEDSDGNGIFQPEMDRFAGSGALQEAGFLFGYYFDDLGIEMQPQQSSYIFVCYGLASENVRDSVIVDFQVPNESYAEFLDGFVAVQGDFPLNSPGTDLTNGMVASQIEVPPLRDFRVSPGESDISTFSFKLPCNGTVSDYLTGLVVSNGGTAQAGSDIAYMRIWREAGGDDDVFDPGLEEFIDFLAWDGMVWRNVSQLHELISCEGLTLHVTIDVAGTALDGRTIRMSLQRDGCEVLSGNDGPIDREVISPATVTVTTDALISSMEAPAFVTVGQQFDVTMVVSNVADTALTAVVPDSFAYWGDGSAFHLSGPSPPSIVTLEGGKDSVFVWQFEAEDSGWMIFKGMAVEGGGDQSSILENSDTLRIQTVPDGFTADISDLTPVSLNRGLVDAPLVTVTLRYEPSTSDAAAIDFNGIGITFTDGAGTPISVNSVASRIHLEDETMVLSVLETSGHVDPSVALALEQPIEFLPQDSHVIRISIDIDESASAENFRLRISQSSDIAVHDRNTGAQVVVGGESFPWSTNTVQLNDPAQALNVLFNDILPGEINRGQEGIMGFEVILSNDGGPASAPINISEIVFHTYDELGDPCFANGLFRSMSVKDGIDNIYFHSEILDDSPSVGCILQPSVIVSPNIPVTLRLQFDCLDDSALAGFAIALEDSLDVSARDDNSGIVLPVLVNPESSSMFPMATGTAMFLDPLQNVSASGEGLLDNCVVAGQQGVDLLRLVIDHAGSPGQSSAALHEIEFMMFDELGVRISPDGRFEVVRLYDGMDEMAVSYLSVVDSVSILLQLTDSLIIAPGESDTLVIIADIDTDAEAGYFQIRVEREDIAITDATDGSAVDYISGEFPLWSGIGSVVIPVEAVGFEAIGKMPENLTAGSDVHIFDLLFGYEDPLTSTDVVVESIDLVARDGHNNVVAPGGVVESARIRCGSEEVPANLIIDADRMRVDFLEPIIIPGNSIVEASIHIVITANPVIDLLSISIESPGDIASVDGFTLNPVSAYALNGSAFPFSSGRGTILSQSMEESFTNYPNPFISSREQTRITFHMPSDGLVTLKLYTLTGRHVITLLDGDRRAAGLHQDVTWDGRNGAGEHVLNGVYYLVIETNTGGTARTMKRKVAVVR